jgi:hypothetical protein|tara:strand:- start:4453 stop:4623 length:171 start_codon:yes stop_codon:yes gene_type:complete
MTKWKYYLKNDRKKENIGTLHASDINEAYAIASRMKQLPLPSFQEMFIVEEYKYEG